MTHQNLSGIWPHVPPAQLCRLIAQLSQMATRLLETQAPAEEAHDEHDNSIKGRYQIKLSQPT